MNVPRALLATLVLLVLFPADKGAADEDVPATIEQLIAAAQRPSLELFGVEPSKQVEAIEALRDCATTSEEEERKVSEALGLLRHSTSRRIAPEALRALAVRNHQELLPSLFAEAEQGTEVQSERLRDFVTTLAGRRGQINTPQELLQAGMASAKDHVRLTAIQLTRLYKAKQLRPELDAMVAGDKAEAVRIAAAQLLMEFQTKESVPALRAGMRGSMAARGAIGVALANLGTEADLDLLIPLLKADSTRLRTLEALQSMKPKNPAELVEAVLPYAYEKSIEVRFDAIKIILRSGDDRALPALQKLFSTDGFSVGMRQEALGLLSHLQTASAVKLLNEIVFREQRVIDILVARGDPSSAYALWDAYLSDPISENAGEIRGNTPALDGMVKLADVELFRAMRLRAKTTKEKAERDALLEKIDQLGTFFPKAAAEAIESISTKAPIDASDRDRDGVPDRADKYPDDGRRSEDIPLADMRPDVSAPTKTYAAIPLGEKSGPSSLPALFMAADEEYRTGWIARVNTAAPPDYYVFTSFAGEREEWPMPNPGDLPGVYVLHPSGINAEGTVVGSATRRKTSMPLHQDIHDVHTSFQSGFVFRRGTLTLDPPAPFKNNALNTDYKRINNRGTIFGHRELKFREGDKDVFKVRAFLGEHVFTEVAPFEVNALTNGDRLLCYRVQGSEMQSFIWDGRAFHELGSLEGRPATVRAFAMNDKCQVVGLSDATDKDKCPIGFFWSRGKMRALPELIPAEYRAGLRSAIPYRIDESGAVYLRAEEKAGPFPSFWPKRNYVLEPSKAGEYILSVQTVLGLSQDGE